MWGLSKLLAAVAAPALALANPAPAEAQDWSRIAEGDLRAARALLLESHPGAAPEAGDHAFRRQLDSGFARALALARAARTFGAYRAALQRFTAAFDHPHISTGALASSERHWPGFAVALGRSGWQVIARAAEDAPPLGSTLLACDGRSPDKLARERLAPFSGSWRARAERVRMSPWLLQDSGNPQHPRLASCTFRSGGSRLPHRLRWASIAPEEIGRQIAAARPAASEEVWLRPFDAGFWIRVGTSGRSGIPIVAEAKRQEAALRAAPFLVLDLRGNAGGASFVTDELAAAI